MGRAARLRSQGVTGKGVGDGKPVTNKLHAWAAKPGNKFVRFSDRAYAISNTGQYRRAKIVVQNKTIELPAERAGE
jgi:hypothetical protein